MFARSDSLSLPHLDSHLLRRLDAGRIGGVLSKSKSWPRQCSRSLCLLHISYISLFSQKTWIWQDGERILQDEEEAGGAPRPDQGNAHGRTQGKLGFFFTNLSVFFKDNDSMSIARKMYIIKHLIFQKIMKIASSVKKKREKEGKEIYCKIVFI